MGTAIGLMLFGGLVAGIGAGLLSVIPALGWLLIAGGGMAAQIGVIAAGVHVGTERLHTALGELDDAVSVLDPTVD